MNPTNTTERTETVIIGGGQAGLATGELRPNGGLVRLGNNVSPAYQDQQLARLDDRNRDHFALPGGDVLVLSRLQAYEGESDGAALCLKWTVEGEEAYAAMLPPGVESWGDISNNEAYLAGQITLDQLAAATGRPPDGVAAMLERFGLSS